MFPPKGVQVNNKFSENFFVWLFFKRSSMAKNFEIRFSYYQYTSPHISAKMSIFSILFTIKSTILYTQAIGYQGISFLLE